MSPFVFYLQSQKEDIECLGNITAVGPDRLPGSCQHEELLTGFP